METILHELTHHSIVLAETDDNDIMDKLGVDSVPSLGYFRNGQMITFEGEIEDNPVGALKFLTDPGKQSTASSSSNRTQRLTNYCTGPA